MAGFAPMLQYLSALEQNNNRPWFHEHHKEYETAVKDFLNLLDLMRFSVAENAPALSESILSMQPKAWMYRVARDARVNRDKPPYDPSLRAYISADRKSYKPIGYFIRLAPTDSCYGTGLWPESGAMVGQVRDHILAHWEELEEILRENELSVSGDGLKRMPRGYEEYADHPAAGLLKLKSWDVIVPLPREVFEDYARFDDTIRTLTRRMEPFRLFMLDACDPRHRSAEQQVTQQLRDFYGSW